jgi:hypothetical protein
VAVVGSDLDLEHVEGVVEEVHMAMHFEKRQGEVVEGRTTFEER